MTRPTLNRRQAECRGCGRVFSSVAAFDKHQTGTDPVRCHDPASLRDKHGQPKLTRNGQTPEGHAVWGSPAGHVPHWHAKSSDSSPPITAGTAADALR